MLKPRGKVTEGILKHITIALALVLMSRASQPIDLHLVSTSQLLERRAEIDRKLREDDFGVYIGMSRWISHAAEKKSVLKEKAAIDAELARRHVTPRQTAVSSAETTPQ